MNGHQGKPPGGSQGLRALHGRAGNLAAALPPLLVEARRVAVSVMHGVHGRRSAGPGEDFWQYRAYARGDDAAAIDWRKSARSEKVLVRETEWMAANSLWLWVQSDAGMDHRSALAAESKRRRAALIALALAMLAQKAGERVAALGGPFRPDHAAAAVERLAHWIDPEEQARREALPPRAQLERFSTCVLIGDFFADPQGLERRIRALAAHGARGHLLQVVDPVEEVFPFRGRVRFEDFSSPRSITFGRAEALREKYAAELERHRQHLRQLTRRLGWSFLVHRTDAPAARALLALHERLGQSGRGGGLS